MYENVLMGSLLAMFLAMGVLIIILIFAVYLYAATALMFIAKKTKTKNSWFAFIPILNFYLLTQMAKESGWWTLTLFLIWIPVVNLFPLGIAIWFFWIIAEKIKYPGWMSLLLLIPIVNLVILGVWAWSKNKR